MLVLPLHLASVRGVDGNVEMACALQRLVGMKTRLVRNLPLFPLVPFVPLAIVTGLVALQVFTLRRLHRLACAIDDLSARRAPPASA